MSDNVNAPIVRHKTEGLVTLEEASLSYGIGIVRLRSWRRNGRLPVRARLRAPGGRRLLFDSSDVEWLVNNPPVRGSKGYSSEQVKALLSISPGDQGIMAQISGLAKQWGRGGYGVHMKWTRLHSKQCGRCNRLLPKKSFASDKSRIDGLQSWCRSCKSQRRRELVGAEG